MQSGCGLRLGEVNKHIVVKDGLQIEKNTSKAPIIFAVEVWSWWAPAWIGRWESCIDGRVGLPVRPCKGMRCVDNRATGVNITLAPTGGT